MLAVTPKMLRDARAGLYTPSLYGKVRGLLQHSEAVEIAGLLSSDIIMLDISFYQDTANFLKMLENDVKGVILRAGQNTWIDIKFHEFMLAAEKAGMLVGSYWFYDSRVEPKEQAKKWKEALGTFKTPLYCWADYEENYGGQYGGWKKFYDFLEACKELMPDRKFGIYTGYYYWLEHSPITTASLNYFKDYPLWLAWYTDDVSFVKIPKPWDKMILWQKTSSGDGTKYGVGSKEVDIDLFMGSAEEFNEMFGFSLPQEEPDTGEDGMQIIKGTTKTNVLLRGDPSTANAVVVFNGKNYVPANTYIEAKVPAVDGKWLNLTKIGDVPVGDAVLWISAGGTQQYVSWQEVTIPDEELPTEPVGLPSTLYIATMEDMSDKEKYVKAA
jgi:GH25 family lysozyme M1 (1,4-beta-N-acetylmuramidase)